MFSSHTPARKKQ